MTAGSIGRTLDRPSEQSERVHGVELTITGLNDRSDRLHQTLSGQMAATH